MSRKIECSSEKGFAHFLILSVITLILFTIVTVSPDFKDINEFYPSETGVKGVLIAKGGDDGGGSSNSGSGSISSDDSEDDSSGSSTPEPTSTSTASTSTAPSVRVKTEQSKDKQKTEVKFSETEKIKTRIEEDKTRIDVYSGGVKVRYEIRDGRVIIKAETEEGQDVPEQELFKIEDKLSTDGIKIATSDGKLLFARNNVGAVSSFPFQIDLNTNHLIASTAAGTKILTVLPDQAVQNIITANVISRLIPQDIARQAALGELTGVKDVITLGERAGAPVYEIIGLKDQKLLGFIPVTTQTTVFVSAQTGEVVAQEQSLLTNIIDLLSP